MIVVNSGGDVGQDVGDQRGRQLPLLLLPLELAVMQVPTERRCVTALLKP